MAAPDISELNLGKGISINFPQVRSLVPKVQKALDSLYKVRITLAGVLGQGQAAGLRDNHQARRGHVQVRLRPPQSRVKSCAALGVCTSALLLPRHAVAGRGGAFTFSFNISTSYPHDAPKVKCLTKAGTLCDEAPPSCRVCCR